MSNKGRLSKIAWNTRRQEQKHAERAAVKETAATKELKRTDSKRVNPVVPCDGAERKFNRDAI
jgi:hypothetical protein